MSVPLSAIDAISLKSFYLKEQLEQRIRLARDDFNVFATLVMRDERGMLMHQAAHHRIWQAHIRWCWNTGLRAAVLAPWAHGKSVQLVVGMSAWLLGRDPNLRIKIICNSDATARARVMEVARIITQNTMYKGIFPNVHPVQAEAGKVRRQWTQHEILLHRSGAAVDPSLQARGITTTGIGGRADILIFDDVVDQRNAIDEPAMRQKVIDNFDRVWMSRLEPTGRALLVGTPWHQADLHHELLKRPAWCTLRQWINKDFTCMDQEVYNALDGYPVPVHQMMHHVTNGNGHARTYASSMFA